MRLKKALALIITMTIAAAALSGCGGKSETAEPQEQPAAEATAVETAPVEEAEEAPAPANSGTVTVSLPKTEESKAEPLQILETGIDLVETSLSTDTAYIRYYAKIYNPNKNTAASFPKVQIIVENPDGTVLATGDQVGMSCMPEDSIALTSQISVPAGQINDETQISFNVSSSKMIAAQNFNIPRSTDFEITGVSEQATAYSTEITGKITNHFSEEVGTVNITAVLKNEGTVVKAFNTFVSDLTPEGTQAFSISTYGDIPEHDTIEVSAQSW